jgi:hypothetical protein
MKKRYIIAGVSAILLWNGFLIHRDAQLFESYNQPISAHNE